MLSIAVVDDDSRCRAEVAAMVAVHMETRGEAFEVAAFADAGEFLAATTDRRFDIAVLDIVMPGQNGMEAAFELHGREPECRFVFLTSTPDYAIHGYRVNAADYLLKPVDAAKLAVALERCRASAVPKTAYPLILRAESGTRVVEGSEILYCRSDDKTVDFQGEGWTAYSRGKLADFLPRLPPCFVQTHRRYLVNLERVETMTRDEMLVPGDRVPISRAFREHARKAYFRHVLGEVEARRREAEPP
jgi:DNA-binding LytR/AlgR family response regulator